ncbi:hypothetical protein AYO21_09259 [Fonsecaea monophora]|uniref:Uncharacterized protein n=1 Tax=Fonsecaea monophora TaxID=254056 RepID=A0A177EX43_9EURO|nr:hypothetical protein AYO21_09259 [Fonsecaea monophora]OAG36528.1 hypothetical protein AYO21_09259 [Fonsecaea monophora]
MPHTHGTTTTGEQSVVTDLEVIDAFSMASGHFDTCSAVHITNDQEESADRWIDQTKIKDQDRNIIPSLFPSRRILPPSNSIPFSSLSSSSPRHGRAHARSSPPTAKQKLQAIEIPADDAASGWHDEFTKHLHMSSIKGKEERDSVYLDMQGVAAADDDDGNTAPMRPQSDSDQNEQLSALPA